MADEKCTGNIKKLLTDKACGFIRTNDGEDFFFHKSGLEQTTMSYAELEEGMAVEFLAVPDAPKGPRAVNVRVI